MSIYETAIFNEQCTLRKTRKEPQPMPSEAAKKWDEASPEQAARRVAIIPHYVQEHSFSERERDRYVSRSLGYLVLLNGAAGLISHGSRGP